MFLGLVGACRPLWAPRAPQTTGLPKNYSKCFFGNVSLFPRFAVLLFLRFFICWPDVDLRFSSILPSTMALPSKTVLVTQTHTIRAIDQCKFSYRRCSGRLGCLVRWDGAHVWRRWWAWGTGMQGGTDKPWRDAASRSSPGSLRLLPPTSLVLPLGVCLLLVAGLLVATLRVVGRRNAAV